MPWPAGRPRANHVAGLTAAEQQLLEQVVYAEGVFEGVHGLYHRLVDRVGLQNAPARRDIANWLRVQPEAQIARMPRKDVSVAPVLPPPRPLSRVFADTMMMPRGAHNAPGVGWKVYRAAVVYVDALTKWVKLHGVFQLVDGRPQSQQTRDGAIAFLQSARAAANDPTLHIEAFRTDKGSEWEGAFEVWRAAEEAANPGFYQIQKSPGTRSSYNSIAERTIQAVRRLMWGHYRAVRRDWDMRGVVERDRRYDWVAALRDIEETWNTGYRATIRTTPAKAIDPAQAPTYGELLQRIRRVARKRYGNRAQLDGEGQPGFSAPGVLQVGTLVRLKRWKDGGGVANLNWERLSNKTADNVWSTAIYTVSAVVRGEGMRLTTYQIQDDQGNPKPGRWSRQQLLPIPQATLALVESTDDDDDDDDDDPEDAVVEQRPLVRQNAQRYQVGDRLHFDANYFAVGQFAGLTPPIVRDRVGTITAAPARARAFAVGRRLYYSVRFDGERTIPLPRKGGDGVDDDPDVQLADA